MQGSEKPERFFFKRPNLGGFLACDSMLSVLYAIANLSIHLSVRLSVCPSITRVDQSKTFKVRIMQSEVIVIMRSFYRRKSRLNGKLELRWAVMITDVLHIFKKWP